MYREISDYAIIGNTETAALISSDGSIDWWCVPHFDSAATFLRLLDDNRGGYCALWPADLVQTKRRYLPQTNILETTLRTGTGVLVLTDFMPVRSGRDPHRVGQDVETEPTIIRHMRCVGGTADVRVEIKPTFSFATEDAQIQVAAPGVVAFHGRSDSLWAHCSHDFSTQDGQVSARIRLNAGEIATLVLTHSSPDQQPSDWILEKIDVALRQTKDYWEEWSRGCTYKGPYRDQVLRSALTLKLLTFEPTGAIIAAPTTSLPEEIGGVRNWDYRFTWLRDSSFTMMALMNIGYFGEAHDFFHFFRRACQCPCDDFQILYGIHGDRQAAESTLDHLDGYRGSKPVRIGNAAATQRQLDIFGELLHCVHLYASLGGFDRHQDFLADMWVTVKTIADHVVQHWREPDHGIWEFRSEPRHFVHSKAMCWVALDSAVKLAGRAGVREDTTRWRHEREVVSQSLIRDGFDPQVGAFVQSYGAKALDASILRLPIMGVIDVADPRMLSTVERIASRLVHNGLVYRYLGADDGLPGGEGTFAICSFWLAYNYAMLGRLPEAEDLFQHVVGFGNDVGLFAEEIDPVNRRQLGNFPQGFTHIGLINAAVRLAAAREGKKPVASAVAEQDGLKPARHRET